MTLKSHQATSKNKDWKLETGNWRLETVCIYEL